MVRGLGKNINVDFTKQTHTDLEKASDRITELTQELVNEKDKHRHTLNVLESIVRRFDDGVSMNVLVEDIRQYLKDNR